MEAFHSGERGRLDIGVSPFRSLYLMPRIVKKLRQQYPGVEIALHEKGSALLRKEAAEGKYDFAVINLPVDESVLDVTLIEPDTLVLAVPKIMAAALPFSSGRTLPQISLKDCGNTPFIVVGQSQEMRQLFDRLCSAEDFHPNISMEVVGVTTAWAMARAGIGATLLPLQFIGNIDFGDELCLYTIKNNIHTRQPAIITRKGQFLSEYARYAIGLLTEKE